MTLRVAVQMDPVHGINIDTDTTFLMMENAQARGHSLWVYTPDKLPGRGQGHRPGHSGDRPAGEGQPRHRR